MSERGLRYGSVCSGIEAATVAWHPLGWVPVFFSEIEAFPRAVLAHRWPGVPVHGDFTTISAGDYEPIDLLVGGTPCQSFSVAGLRGGVVDERGNLALEYLLLARRLRPRWLVWENVPGVFSSLSHAAPDPMPPLDPLDLGCDGQEVDVEDEYDSEELHALNCFLAGLSKCGYGFAYRVLDAQHFGVPQRRRRVFVVGYLGDWRPPAAVLFERQSLRGDSAPRREARQDVARPSASCPEGGSGWRADADTADNLIANTLKVPSHGAAWRGDGSDNFIAPTILAGSPNDGPGHRARSGRSKDELIVAAPLTSRFAKHGGASAGKDSLPHNLVAGTLRAHPHPGSNSLDAFAFDTTQITSRTNRSNPQPGNPVGSLSRAAHAPVVAFGGNKQAGPIDIATACNAHGGPHGRLDFESETFVVGTLNANGKAAGSATQQDAECGLLVTHALKAEGADGSEDGTGRGVPLTLAIRGRGDGHDLEYRNDGIANAILTPNGGRAGIGVGAIAAYGISSDAIDRSGEGDGSAGERAGLGIVADGAPAIRARSTNSVAAGMEVRRLMPIECERLQGFPDNYTRIPVRTLLRAPSALKLLVYPDLFERAGNLWIKFAEDGPRYRSLGNSMAVPCMRWIGQRIALVERLLAGRNAA